MPIAGGGGARHWEGSAWFWGEGACRWGHVPGTGGCCWGCPLHCLLPPKLLPAGAELPFPFALQLLPAPPPPAVCHPRLHLCQSPDRAVPRHRPARAASHARRGGWRCPQRGRRPGGPCPSRGPCAAAPAPDAPPSPPHPCPPFPAQGTSRGERSHRGQAAQAGGGCARGVGGCWGAQAGARPPTHPRPGGTVPRARGWQRGGCGAAAPPAVGIPGRAALGTAAGRAPPCGVPGAQPRAAGRRESRAAPSCWRCRWGWSPPGPRTAPGWTRTRAASPGRASTATCRVSGGGLGGGGGGALPLPPRRAAAPGRPPAPPGADSRPCPRSGGGLSPADPAARRGPRRAAGSPPARALEPAPPAADADGRGAAPGAPGLPRARGAAQPLPARQAPGTR